jgi:hypothetical protein
MINVYLIKDINIDILYKDGIMEDCRKIFKKIRFISII